MIYHTGGEHANHYTNDAVFVGGRSVVFSGTLVSSTNKTDRYDMAEILLNTINQTNQTI